MYRPVKPRYSTIPLALAAFLLAINLCASAIYPFKDYWSISAQNVRISPLATDGTRLEENGLSSRVVGIDWSVMKGLLGAMIGGAFRPSPLACSVLTEGTALSTAAASSVLSALDFIIYWRARSRIDTPKKRDKTHWRFGYATPTLALCSAVCAGIACLLDLVLLGLAKDAEAVRFGMAWYLVLLSCVWPLLLHVRALTAMQSDGIELVWSGCACLGSTCLDRRDARPTADGREGEGDGGRDVLTVEVDECRHSWYEAAGSMQLIATREVRARRPLFLAFQRVPPFHRLLSLLLSHLHLLTGLRPPSLIGPGLFSSTSRLENGIAQLYEA